MNQEIKTKWVEALRSGEYKQGTNRLRTGDEYCCLGVLCDIYAKETGLGKWNKNTINATIFNYVTNEKQEFSILPIEVSQWAEVDSQNPIVTTERYSLASLNDDGASFNKIADIIEKEL